MVPVTVLMNAPVLAFVSEKVLLSVQMIWGSGSFLGEVLSSAGQAMNKKDRAVMKVSFLRWKLGGGGGGSQ